MAFLYLAEPEEESAIKIGASSEKADYTWAIAIGVVLVALVGVIVGISLVAIKISQIKEGKQQPKVQSTGPESEPMPVNEEEGVVRLDATVSNSDA